MFCALQNIREVELLTLLLQFLAQNIVYLIKSYIMCCRATCVCMYSRSMEMEMLGTAIHDKACASPNSGTLQSLGHVV